MVDKIFMIYGIFLILSYVLYKTYEFAIYGKPVYTGFWVGELVWYLLSRCHNVAIFLLINIHLIFRFFNKDDFSLVEIIGVVLFLSSLLLFITIFTIVVFKTMQNNRNKDKNKDKYVENYDGWGDVLFGTKIKVKKVILCGIALFYIGTMLFSIFSFPNLFVAIPLVLFLFWVYAGILSSYNDYSCTFLFIE